MVYTRLNQGLFCDSLNYDLWVHGWVFDQHLKWYSLRFYSFTLKLSLITPNLSYLCSSYVSISYSCASYFCITYFGITYLCISYICICISTRLPLNTPLTTDIFSCLFKHLLIIENNIISWRYDFGVEGSNITPSSDGNKPICYSVQLGF